MKAVVIGASLGGLATFKEIFKALPINLDFPIYAINHITPRFDRQWVQDLKQEAPIPVHWARNNTKAENGHIYFAPPDYHLEIGLNKRMLLTKQKALFSCRPAIDPLFKSIAEAYKHNSLAIILTGLNSDGCQGIKNIKEHSGQILILKPEDAKHSHMPQEAANLNLTKDIFSLEQIINNIAQF